MKVWATHYAERTLRFEKWGHIDAISDYPANRALFIDTDSLDSARLTILRINSTFRAMGLPEGYTAIRFNRSKRGWHTVILLKKGISAVERVTMESILGDDSMRAAMNLARARNVHRMPKFWKQRWNIFYDYKVVTDVNTEMPKMRGLQSPVSSHKRQD